MEKTNHANVTKQEILGLEKKYWKAMQDHDLHTALELSDFPTLVVGAEGIRAVDKKQFEEMFRSQDPESIRTVEIDEANAQIRVVGPDTAVIAYQVHTKFTHEGKEVDMKAFDTSTWIRRENKWVCAMHTEIEKTKHSLN